VVDDLDFCQQRRGAQGAVRFWATYWNRTVFAVVWGWWQQLTWHHLAELLLHHYYCFVSFGTHTYVPGPCLSLFQAKQMGPVGEAQCFRNYMAALYSASHCLG
jgi:hypothetical protein